MSKRIGRRRFDEPRYGVSELMIEAEARELDRELESYLLLSSNALKEKSERLLRSYRQTDESLHAAINRLPERERLTVMCMLGRDLYLVLAVFLNYLQKHEPEAHTSVQTAEPATVPFSEWLFVG